MTGKSNGDEYEARNIRVQNALYRAALGYKVKLKKPVKVKEETNRPGEGKQVVERMVTVEEQKYVEPKITAQMFWLKSRMPEQWGSAVPDGTAGDMEPVLETYARLLDEAVPDRPLEDLEDDGEDPLCPAE